MLKCPCLIVVCGWPISGKTTLGRQLSVKLKIPFVDIDEVRKLFFGIPDPHPDRTPELMQKDAQEMRASYVLLLEGARLHLSLGRSFIVAATFSRKSGQLELADLRGKFPKSALKVIWCKPQNDTIEEITRRLQRGFGEQYCGGVNSIARYLEIKARFEPIELPHLELDTSPPYSVQECAQHALTYILT